MLYSESSFSEHDPTLGGAERLLKTIMEDLDPRSFTHEEIFDNYTPLVIEGDKEKIDDAINEDPEEITQEQLTTLIRRGFIEQHGDDFAVTRDGEKYYEDLDDTETDTEDYLDVEESNHRDEGY